MIEATTSTAQTTQSGTPFARKHDGSVFTYRGSFGEDQLNAMLIWCTEKRASDITIQPDIPVKAEIGGEIVSVTDSPLTPHEVEKAVIAIYGANGPAEIMSGFDLDPSYELRLPDGDLVRYRVNVTGGRMIGGKGMQLTIRTLPGTPVDYRKLDLEPAILANFRPEQGLILVTGPTGSGKSTLLSSLIRKRIEEPDANEKVLEYSSPIEYVYDDVEMPSSVVWQSHAGRDLRPRSPDYDERQIFAHCTRNGMRRKPTIIIIGEARDKATIEATVEAALTGHLVFSTMHTIGVGETLRRAVMPFPDETRRGMAVDIMESLRMIVTQLLLPRVGGGKIGCREYMVFSRDVREAFLREDIDTWPRFARRLLAEERAIGSTMAQSALKLLGEGKISEATFERVAAKGKAA